MNPTLLARVARLLFPVMLFWIGTAQAALVSRLGGQAVYDTDRDITWIADANLAASNTFGTAGIDAAGFMSWDTANTWIENMNASNGGAGYLGFNDWRLPTTMQPDPSCSNQTADVPPQGSGTGCTGSEMGHLFNEEGVSATVPGLFSNVQSGSYWSGTEFAPDPTHAWRFHFFLGSQFENLKGLNRFAWAVRSGDVSAVPVPAAIWLFGSGLMGLAGFGLRRRR